MEEKTMLDTALELLQAKQYSKLKELFAQSEPADIADVLSELKKAQYLMLYRLLPKGIAAQVFVEMDADAQKNLIDSFSDTEITEMLGELYYDDTVDIIEEMPANVADRILKNALPETRKTINDLLRYPESSAGSIMTTEYVYLTRNMTVADALERIRKVAIEKETSDLMRFKQKIGGVDVYMYADRIAKYIADYYLELEGKVDAIVFTAGVLENGYEMREMVAKRLAPLGVVLNPEMNSNIAGFKEIHEGIITEPASRINIMVLPTDEEIMIVKDTFNLIINE
jgi:hypothetical protein